MRSLLTAPFVHGLPARLAALLPSDLTLADVMNCHANVVLPQNGRPPRIAVADTGRPGDWLAGVAEQWPGVHGFLAAAPERCRRMVDSDGSAVVEAYVDDLVVFGHEGTGPLGGERVAYTFWAPSGNRGLLTKHALLPPLPALVEAGVLPLSGRAPGGMWMVRFLHDEPVGVVWVSESRWRDDPPRTRALLGELGLPPGFVEMEAAAAAAGVQLFPDTLDLQPDGSWDVTVGIHPQRA